MEEGLESERVRISIARVRVARAVLRLRVDDRERALRRREIVSNEHRWQCGERAHACGARLRQRRESAKAVVRHARSLLMQIDDADDRPETAVVSRVCRERRAAARAGCSAGEYGLGDG